MNTFDLTQFETVLGSYARLDELIEMLDKPSRKNLGLIISVSEEQSKQKDEFLGNLTSAKKNKLGIHGFYKDIAVVNSESVGLWLHIVPKDDEIYTTVYATKRKTG